MPHEQKRVEDLLKCTRINIFEDDDFPECPYNFRGTSFIVKRGQEFFAITATHALGDRAPEDLRLYPHDECRDSIPFDRRVECTDTHHIHSDCPADYADVVIMHVAKNLMPGTDLEKMIYADLDHLPPPLQSMPRGQHIFFSGYPHQRQVIDYNACHISRQRICLEGEYDSISPDQVGRQRMIVNNWGPVTDPDGFSGSPCFTYSTPDRSRWVQSSGGIAYPQSDRQPVYATFAGLIVQASAQSGYTHFIESKYIYNMLDNWQGISR